MKILILNQTFHPDVAATAQYVSDLALALVERGHKVTAVSGRRAYDDGPGEQYAARETWRGIEIRRISGTRLGKTARWRRAVDFGTYLLNCSLHLLALPRYDLVIALTSPPLISWIGAVFTRVKGGRFAFWVMDLNPDEAVAAGWLREGALITRALQWLLRDSLHHSALVVALDDFMATRIAAKGVDAARIQVLPPWSLDESLRYDELGRNAFRTKHGFEGKFVVMYSGNHSPCHPLTTLLDAAIALRDRSDIAFAFIGGGSEQATVKRVAAEQQLSNVLVLPYQPLAGLAGSLSSADLHVVVMGDPFVGIVHPSKVYNIRALGIPYLYIGPAESHVTALDPPYVAAHGDVAGVVRHIEVAAAAGVGVRGERSLAPWEHSRERLLCQLVEALERAGGVTAGHRSVTVDQQGDVLPTEPSWPSWPSRPSEPSSPSRPSRPTGSLTS